MTVDPDVRREFERAFVALLVRLGANAQGLELHVSRTLEESLAALAYSAQDGASLTAIEVLRIRLGKFAAARLPAKIFRDAPQLAALRSEIRELALGLLPRA